MNALDLMQARLGVRGGNAQQDRMIKDKRETLDRAVLYSYQGAKVRKIDSTTVVRALINPNTVKQDYDDKIISVGFEHGFAAGDVFEWVNTGTYWLSYLQDLTELAYYRSDIRRCRYSIAWEDENGESHFTYAAIKGPAETNIETLNKSNYSIDLPNHTLHLLVPSNEETRKLFRRYTKFYIKPLEVIDDNPICWRIEATDTISTPGIIECIAHEYYSNLIEDDIEEGIVGGKIEPMVPEIITPDIEGEAFIKPKKTYTYTYLGNLEGTWKIDPKLPVKYAVDGKSITLTWESTYRGEFILAYGDIEKTIVVESLF